MKAETFTIEVHFDPVTGYEAAVQELPGCFAAGETSRELREALTEAITQVAPDLLQQLRLTHHIPYVDEGHIGGNCAETVMRLLLENDQLRRRLSTLGTEASP